MCFMFQCNCQLWGPLSCYESEREGAACGRGQAAAANRHGGTMTLNQTAIVISKRWARERRDHMGADISYTMHSMGTIGIHLCTLYRFIRVTY